MLKIIAEYLTTSTRPTFTLITDYVHVEIIDEKSYKIGKYEFFNPQFKNYIPGNMGSLRVDNKLLYLTFSDVKDNITLYIFSSLGDVRRTFLFKNNKLVESTIDEIITLWNDNIIHRIRFGREALHLVNKDADLFLQEYFERYQNKDDHVKCVLSTLDEKNGFHENSILIFKLYRSKNKIYFLVIDKKRGTKNIDNLIKKLDNIIENPFDKHILPF